MKLVYRTKQALLAVGDIFSFSLAFWLSLAIRSWNIPVQSDIEKHLLPFSIIFLLWLIINYINGLYDLESHSIDRKFLRRFAEAAGFSLVLSMAFFYLFPDQKIAPKTILILNIIFGYGLSYLWRLTYKYLIDSQSKLTKVLMIGHTPEVDFLIETTRKLPEKGYELVAIIDPDNTPGDSLVPVYNQLDEISKVIANHNIDMVVIASHLQKNTYAERQLYNLLFSHIEIIDLPAFYETLTGRIPPSTFSEGWFLQNLRGTEKPIYDKLRAGIDRIFGLILLGLFLTVMPIISLLIKTTSRGPIFIKQIRVGQNGKHFKIYKFRSMYALSPDGSAEVGEYSFDKWVATKKDERITPLGKFLRRSRIDEWPQAINLLRGDLTLIGPRPERPEITAELVKRLPFYSLRLLVKPGLTGWALIHQNYTDTFDKALEKIQYDLYYIKNRSFILDIVISLRTINVLFRLMGQ